MTAQGANAYSEANENTISIPLAQGHDLPEQIRKRSGELVKFDSMRIYNAIAKAGKATGQINTGEATSLTVKVLKTISHRFGTGCPDLEQIQDIVEQCLVIHDYLDTARAYIAYRKQRDVAREDQRSLVDAERSINEYLSRGDWRVKENANQGYSLGGLILNTAGKVTANYWLNHVYSKDIGEAHINGDYHIHDLGVLGSYCAGWSLRTLLHEGFNGVDNRVESRPPKHLSSALAQMVNFLGTMQNEWAGAQAFSSFDTYLAPYIKIDNLSYDEVHQALQGFVYNCNVPSRWGSQAPFTNITLDWVCPEDLKDKNPIIGGKEVDFTYGDCVKEMAIINKAYMRVMTEGDAKGRVFTFPIPTYNITKDFDWHGENTDELFEMTAKYGLPYFQNFINSDLDPSMVRSMCCRLQLDLRELLARGGGLFGSAEQTGSVGVVTINCARLGYNFKGNWNGLIARLDDLLERARNSLEIKRKTCQQLMDQGLFPYSKRYLGTYRNHFSTIGVNGINEMVRNFTNDATDISKTDGNKMAVDFLDHIRARMVQFQEETGHLYNLEATPAEGTTYRFAKEDQKRYPDIIQAGTKESPYYTNSSQLPVNFTQDPFEALDMQDELQRKYTGGTVLHLYMSERLSSAEACRQLVKNSLSNYKLPYLTVTPTFSTCPTHGYLNGEHAFCPKCDAELLATKKQAEMAKRMAATTNLAPLDGSIKEEDLANVTLNDNERQECEIWTRVMGYHRPVSQFNIGKKQEQADRIHFEESKACDHIMDNIDVSALSDEERQECEIWTRVMGYHRPVSQFNIGKKQEQADRVHFEESVAREKCDA